LLIVLGSGGHTAEMLAMLRGLDPCAYNHRSYVVSSGDAFSADKAIEFEAGLVESVRGREGRGSGEGEGVDGVNENMKKGFGAEANGDDERSRKGEGTEETVGSYDITFVPRARRIHQTLLTTPISALHCLWACLQLLRSTSCPSHLHRPLRLTYPDLILTNGPGTAVIVVLASLILRFFDVDRADNSGSMRTVYAESWARVNRLSLSGRLLVRVVDRFLVQWEGLEGVAGRGEFLGVLV